MTLYQTFKKHLKKINQIVYAFFSADFIFEWKNDLYKIYKKSWKFTIKQFFAKFMYIQEYKIICAIYIQIIKKKFEMYSSISIMTAQIKLKNYWKSKNQIAKYVENYSKVFYFYITLFFLWCVQRTHFSIKKKCDKIILHMYNAGNKF